MLLSDTSRGGQTTCILYALSTAKWSKCVTKPACAVDPQPAAASNNLPGKVGKSALGEPIIFLGSMETSTTSNDD